ncbi:MAG: SUMF1/EgtB/PvdO family nonheme iron enzyme [Sandaracinaceae bacterium]
MADALTHAAIAERLERCRARTLARVEALDDDALTAWPHEGFSPIGWHLGHIGFTEAQWILGECAGQDHLHAPHFRAWSQAGCPKAERRQQPPKAELLGYLARVREAVLEVLPTLDLESDRPLLAGGFVGWFVEAHEHQHRETIALVRQLALERELPPPPPPAFEGAPSYRRLDGGRFEMGTDDRLAYDNERCAHEVEVGPFAMSELATVAAWDAFRAGGGYARPELWSAEGWAWREAEGVEHPRGWTIDADGALARPRLDGRLHPLSPDEPVVGVSFHEAEAFARFFDARLPTEAEWEHAARSASEAPLDHELDGPVASDALRGNAWVWTSTPFAPYDGFAPFPYHGYSAPYYDGVHRVLRGGSFASDPAVARVTFRNWYQPWVREIFSGVRLARA